MSRLFLRSAELSGQADPQLRARLVSALLTGLLCAVGAIALNLLMLTLSGVPGFSPDLVIGSVAEKDSGSGWKLLAAITVGPVLETLIFLFAWLAIDERTWTARRKHLAFVVALAMVGWSLHGADAMSISRAYGFLVLALLFDGWSRRGPLAAAFWTTALAHGIWNASALAGLAVLTALLGN